MPINPEAAGSVGEPSEFSWTSKDSLLYALGVEGHVQAMFASEEAPRPGDRVEIDLPYSGEHVSGTVAEVGEPRDPDAFIGLPRNELRAPGRVYAKIETDKGLPAALAGSPVVVKRDPPKT